MSKQRKRGQNEGSIFEEKPGRWAALMTLGYEVVDGTRRRIRRKFVGETREAVRKRLTEALRKQDTGLPVERGRTPFRVVLNRWIDEVARRELQPSTLISYESLIKNHIEPALGSIVLTELHTDKIDGFMSNVKRIPPKKTDTEEKRQPEPLSPRSIQYCHAIIRRALRQAQKWGMIGHNAASNATPPKSAPKEVQPFTPEQARSFLLAISGDRMEAFYNVALSIGLRRGEALGLMWSDIDFGERMVTVRRSLQRLKEKGKGGRLVLSPWTKTQKPRSIALPRFAVERLLEHRDRQQKERILACEAWTDKGLVFTTRKGTPIEPRNALRRFHGLLDVVGLPHHRLHDLRHTAASLMLAQGASLFEVKETLGHSQIKLTADLYGHLFDAAKRQTAERMERAFGYGAVPDANPVAPQVAPSKPN